MLDPIAVRLDPPGLEGLLRLPARVSGLAVFAHGSGSGRLSPRNNHVAAALGRAGFATLLFDLLTEEEAADRSNVFDIGLLGERLCRATDWAQQQEPLRNLPIGYFGASTGAAAALTAAAARPAVIGAVVSRGGRPDLAAPVLGAVRAPTLLIVGSLDHAVLDLNRKALAGLAGQKALEIVSGATHLFEEPGTLDRVVVLAADWFRRFLVLEPVEKSDVAT